MNRFIFVYLLIFSYFGSICSQSDERIYRVISFELHGFDRLDNKLASGICCDGPHGNDTDLTCPNHCKTTMNLHLIKHNGLSEITHLVNDETESLIVRAYHYETIKLDPAKSIRHDIYYESDTKLMEYWMGPKTDTNGMVWMNGVWGHHGKVRIIATFDHFHPDPFAPIRSFYFYTRRMIWMKRQFSSTTTCCDDSTTAGCPNACPFNVSTYVDDSLVWESPRIPYTGPNQTYFLKTGGSTLNVAAFKHHIKFSMKFKTPSGNLIDEITMEKLSLYPNQEKEMEEVEGIHKNIKIDLIIRYDCVSHSGMNCKFDCKNTNGKVGCRHDTGQQFCLNGAPNVPDCDQPRNNTCIINPCENGATCSALPKSFVCYCKRGFIGRYCEIPACQYECYHGTCDDSNNCICDDGYNGHWCDETPCKASDQNFCHDLSRCVRIREERTCVCESFASGDDCKTPVCIPACRAGTCVWDSDNREKPTKCQCDEGYIGEECDRLENAPKFYRLGGNIIALSIMSIITFILAKLLLLTILLKPKGDSAINMSEAAKKSP